MTLNRLERPNLSWSPMRQLSLLRDEIDRMFESPLTGMGTLSQPFMGGGWPTVDIFEDNDSVSVRAELPGMNKNDIDISLHENVLSISGERKQDPQFENVEVHRSERFVGRFHRSVTIPTLVNSEACQAKYEDGVLTVVLPKAETAKPKQIKVMTAK